MVRGSKARILTNQSAWKSETQQRAAAKWEARRRDRDALDASGDFLGPILRGICVGFSKIKPSKGTFRNSRKFIYYKKGNSTPKKNIFSAEARGGRYAADILK